MLSRSLIAAAGNAGAGELSYWVAEVYSSNVTEYLSARAEVNETNGNIVVRTWNTSNQWFFELDYDGGLDDSSTTSNVQMPGSGYDGTLVASGGNTYSLNMSAYSTLRFLDVDDLSVSSFSGKQFSNAVTGFVNNPATKQMMVVDDSQTDERVVLVTGGYFDYDVAYESRFTAWTYNITDGAVDSTRTKAVSYNESGYGIRYPQVAKGTSGKFAISYTDVGDTATGKTGFATYTNGASPALSHVHAPSTQNMKNFALRIDENDKLCAVTCVSNQHWFWRGTTAGTYTPNVYYGFNAYSAIGNVISASIDSAGNMYVLGYQGAFDGYRLLKFNTSNAVEWVLQFKHQNVSPYGQPFADVNIQSIDGEDFLLLSLVYQVENTNQYPVYIIKAPLDFENYTGTYGHIIVSTISFSPTVTTNTFTTTSVNYGTFTTNMGHANTTQANTATTASTTVTDI
jgi:hypothetical protein